MSTSNDPRKGMLVCRVLPLSCLAVMAVSMLLYGSGIENEYVLISGFLSMFIYFFFQITYLPNLLLEGRYRLHMTRFGGIVGISPWWYLPFVAFTFGFGPMIWYWKEVDPVLKSMIRQKSSNSVKNTKSHRESGSSREKDFPVDKVVMLVAIGGVVISGYWSLYTVSPHHDAIVFRGDEIVAVKPPGLHWKVPLVDEVHLVPSRKYHLLRVASQLNGRYEIHVQWWISDKIKYLETSMEDKIGDRLKLHAESALGKIEKELGVGALESAMVGKAKVSGEKNPNIERIADAIERGIGYMGISVERVEVVEKK